MIIKTAHKTLALFDEFKDKKSNKPDPIIGKGYFGYGLYCGDIHIDNGNTQNLTYMIFAATAFEAGKDTKKSVRDFAEAMKELTRLNGKEAISSEQELSSAISSGQYDGALTLPTTEMLKIMQKNIRRDMRTYFYQSVGKTRQAYFCHWYWALRTTENVKKESEAMYYAPAVRMSDGWVHDHEWTGSLRSLCPVKLVAKSDFKPKLAP